MRGYANSKTNPAVVQLIAVMALSAAEANQLCHGIKGYIPREVFLSGGCFSLDVFLFSPKLTRYLFLCSSNKILLES